MWIKKIAVCRTELCVLFYWFLFLIPYPPHSNSVLKSFSYFLGGFPFLPSVSSNYLEKWGGNVAELKLQYWILLLWSCQFLRCHVRSLRKKVLWNCISKWTIYFCHSSEVIDFNSFCGMVKWARIGFPNISGYRLCVLVRSLVISYWSHHGLLHSLRSLWKITSPFHQHLLFYFTKSFLQNWNDVQGFQVGTAALDHSVWVIPAGVTGALLLSIGKLLAGL